MISKSRSDKGSDLLLNKSETVERTTKDLTLCLCYALCLDFLDYKIVIHNEK